MVPSQPILFNVIAIRALKVFVASFLSVVATGLVAVIDISTLRALVVAAVAAGFSAVINLFIQPQEAR